jgi:hypothetical protein
MHKQLKRLRSTAAEANAVNKKSEEEDAAAEDVEIIGNSVLLLLIHMKTLRIVWGLDEAVREEQKQNPARQNKKVPQGSLRPFACAPQSHAGRWLSSRKRAARGHSHRSGG